MSSASLTLAILVGSHRAGRQAEHVLNVVTHALKARSNIHVTVIDANENDLPVLKTPHHHYGLYVPAPSPAPLPTIASQLEQADAFIILDTEYNHSPSPGILNLLDHFYHGQYKHKTAAIMTYSAQQTGGARSAFVLRNTLGELGMITIPSIYMVPNVFTAIDYDTQTLKDEAATLRLENFLNEMEWYAQAVKTLRSVQGVPVVLDKLVPAASQPRAAKDAVVDEKHSKN